MQKMISAKLVVKAAVVAYNPEFYQQNKERFAAKSKAWREANKERAKENRRRNYVENKEANLLYSKAYNLKRNFNLTTEEYAQMLEKQGGVCAICSKTCTRSLAVDHDHITGVVRGLLCNNCNRGLGHLQDDVTILENAVSYLKGQFCGQ